MSSTSSILLGYDNNNDVKCNKMKRPSVAPIGSSSVPRSSPWCARIHLNSLWSLWYGFFGTILQAYVGVKCMKRILGESFLHFFKISSPSSKNEIYLNEYTSVNIFPGYSLLAWPDISSIPVLELNTSLALTGLSVLLLPLFLASAAFKVCRNTRSYFHKILPYHFSSFLFLLCFPDRKFSQRRL